MTLVVSRMNGEQALAVSGDSLAADDAAARQPSLVDSVLKVIIVDAGLCLGVAGSQHAARAALRSLPMRPSTLHPTDAVLSHLANQSERDDTDVEFLALESTPRPSLYTVRRGHVDRAFHRQAWVGDRAGFSRFQAASREMAQKGSTRGPAFVSPLAQALESVVEDGDVPSVGGFVVTAYTQADGFRYLLQAKLSTGTVNPQVIPAGGGTVQWAQGPHDGSYSQVLAVPAFPGIGALGVWVREWSSGIFHWPLGLDDSVILDARTSRGFIEEVKLGFGIQLQAAVSL